jgi:hypothetical protein
MMFWNEIYYVLMVGSFELLRRIDLPESPEDFTETVMAGVIRSRSVPVLFMGALYWVSSRNRLAGPVRTYFVSGKKYNLY